MDQDKIRSTLERVLEEHGHEPLQKRQDISFHLTDWLADLAGWTAFCENPDSYSPQEINSLVIELLVHVPNHLAAASKLMLDIPVTDIFEVGAVEADE